MSSQGPNSGATFADDSTLGSISVTNPGNVSASDNSYATAVLLSSQISHYLKATNFGFTIPTDATIDGILVEIERSSTIGVAVVDDSVKMVQGGTISGAEKATASQWPTSDAYASYGGSTDLWGLTWTPAQINASTFGVAIASTTTLAATAQIDHVRITVYWTGSNRSGNTGSYVTVGGGMSRSERAS